MASYKLLNYAGAGGKPRAGILVGEEVIDLADAGLPGSTLELLQDWEENHKRLSSTST